MVFEDNVDCISPGARAERMSLITKALPAGVRRPSALTRTGVGHVFRITVESPTLSLRDLRTLQDWFIRYSSTPSRRRRGRVGWGYVQQYQIDVDPNRLRTYNLPLRTVVCRPRQQPNVGGNVLESNGAC